MLNSSSQRVLPAFPSTIVCVYSSIALHLHLWSILSGGFWYIVQAMLHSSLSLSFFACARPIVTALFFEKAILPPLNWLCIFVRNQLHAWVSLFLSSLFSSIDPLVYFDTNSSFLIAMALLPLMRQCWKCRLVVLLQGCFG